MMSDDASTGSPGKPGDVFHKLLERTPHAKIPPWLPINDAPTLHALDKTPLAIAAGFAEILAKTIPDDVETVQPALQQLEPRSLERFILWIFDRWTDAGCPGRYKWALFAVTCLEEAVAVPRLAEFIRTAISNRKTARAKLGLEALARIGSDAALAQLDSLGRAARSAAIRRAAEAVLNAFARRQGLSRDELADRIMPTGGFGPDGLLVLDYGARQFRLRLLPDFTVAIEDATGKRRASLPRAAAGDDEPLARRAKDAFQLAKKTAKDFPNLQGARLEEAMVSQRLWRLEVWRQRLVHHPLMRILVQRLVWSALDLDKKESFTFRVAEDYSFASVDDDPLKLDGRLLVSIPHPLQLDPSLLARWRDLFRDYDVVQPFDQLERRVYRAADPSASSVEWFSDSRVDGRSVIHHLAKRGWLPGEVRTFGSVFHHVRYFAAAEITAVLHHGMAIVGDYSQGVETEIGELVFLRGHVHKVDDEIAAPAHRMRLGDVDAIAFSEAVRDVALLTRRTDVG